MSLLLRMTFGGGITVTFVDNVWCGLSLGLVSFLGALYVPSKHYNYIHCILYKGT